MSSTASCLAMQPSWEPPEAEVSLLASASSHPMTLEDAACQDAGGCPGEGYRVPRTPSCWERCRPTGKGGLHQSAGSSVPKAVEVTCHC